MSEPTKASALHAEIAARLPVLEKRVRTRELTDVIHDALARNDTSPTGFLALAALYSSRWSARRDRLTALRKAYTQAQSAEGRIAVIEQALRDEQAPRRTLAAVRRGQLDLDAMAERAEFDLHGLELRQSLALRAAAALTTHGELPEVLNSLLALLLTQPSTLCAVACAEALHELLTRLRQTVEPDARWQQLCSFLTDSGSPRRVLAALLRLCLRAVPELALEQVGILLRRITPGDDFLLRQHALVLLTERGEDPAAFSLLSAKADLGDPSEHVRIALPAALRATGGEAAVPLLEFLAGAEANDLHGDESPRVRAAAALALCDLLRSCTAETTPALTRVLRDPHPIVFGLTCEAIEELATQYRLSESEATALETVLNERAATAISTALAEPALRALQVLATITDPKLTIARSLLELPLKAGPGDVVHLATNVDPLTLGRLLAQLARGGFGIYAQRTPDGYRVERGGQFVFRTWRLLHELRWMTPYKRQDAVHLVGRLLPGTLRAPSSLLAEVTPTSVPGEPLTSTADGTWGPHLPTVDDLLSMPLASTEPVWIFTTRGVTEIKPPPSLSARLHARMLLTTRYAELSDLRRRALDPADASEPTRYIESVETLGFQILLRSDPATRSAALRVPPTIAAPFGHRVQAMSSVPAALAMLVDPESLGGLVHYLMSPAENTLGQLGCAAGLVCAGMLVNNIRRRRRIAEDRAAIPLVIGGWGTRGKSGTERLKAALLHGQGIDVFTKTTGCEAMFIHGVPGRKPTEIFIHRPYDKATIWEQRDMLSLAAKLHASAFLWECMALSAPLVRVLSEEWMRDDYQTLTNAYPDHEDIQGPAGHDVARSIAAFIRTGGTAITTEEQMLPILVDEAERKQAKLITVPGKEHLLLADDLLARFPYREHPRNIALVRRLAVELGLDPDLATADMADHVVPDLGVLKIYPTMRHRDRRLTFINGMSANERAGFMSNWQRTGCERPVDQPGRWVVTVVNNRFDRVARSKVFAEILVRDASAERHILIGTNLSGLRVYVSQALTQLLQELWLFRDGDEPAQVSALLRARCDRQRHRLRIGPAEPEAVLAELSAWLGGVDVSQHRSAVRQALAAAVAYADEDSPLSLVEAKLRALPFAATLAALRPERGEDLMQHFMRSLARRALLASLERAAERAIGDRATQQAVLARQDRIYRELFMDLLVSVDDPAATGDQVLDVIARSCPPGIDATVMGIQNIKGTGLDFVHRFIRYEEVDNLVKRLEGAEGEAARSIAAELLGRSDFGMLDADLAAEAVKRAARRETEPEIAQHLTQTAAHLADIAERLHSALEENHGQKSHPLARVLSKGLDSAAAVRRRWRADSLLDALVHREISHERAALEARRLVEQAKK